MNNILRKRYSVLVLSFLVFTSSTIVAQNTFTIEQVLSPGYPYELVAANNVDRIAWFEYEQGMRNVYTAAAPDFTPIRLTDNLEDNGNDLTHLSISNDGSIVVFVRGHRPNRDGWNANPTTLPDGSKQAIWAVRTSGGKPWQIVEANNPILSPNGKWVLFQKEGEIFEVPVEQSSSIDFNKTQLKPLFRTFGRDGNLQWSPNSKKIAFVSDRRDHSFIGIYDHEKRKITYIAPTVDRDSSPTWSPDGKKIAFIRRPGSTFSQIVSGNRQTTSSRERNISQRISRNMASAPGFRKAVFNGGHTITFWIGDVEAGRANEIWKNPLTDSTFEDIRSIQWEGNHLLFSLERNNWQHYYAVPISRDKNSEPINLTPGDGIAEFIDVSNDGKYLFYSTNTGDLNRRHLWKTPTKGGKPKQLTKGKGIETYPAVLASGKKVAVLYADARRPQSVALVSSNGGNVKIIAPHLPKDFPFEEQVVPENIVLTAEDGMQFHNQIFIPKNIRKGEKKPAMLFTHGGPRRQMLLGYHYRHFYHMAYAINQYFANQGYVTISVNYRSGIGYGKEFRMAENRGRRGSSEYMDVVAAGKYLQNRPDVNPEQIGLWGLSYGGILTAMGLSRNSDIFSAGVDIAGIHLWGSSLDTSDVSFQSSAVATIDKWTSPVLLIHGDDDRNVAFSQTTGLVQLLRAHDVYHELIVFPDDVHDSLLYKRWLITFHAADDFFARLMINQK